MNYDAIPSNEAAAQPIYLSCSPEDLIGIEMDAWRSGYHLAYTDADTAFVGVAAIEEAGEQVCDQALEVYIPLDLVRFRDVFTRAWCAGYCSGQRERGRPDNQVEDAR